MSILHYLLSPISENIQKKIVLIILFSYKIPEITKGLKYLNLLLEVL